MSNFEKMEIVLTGVGALEAPRMNDGAHFVALFDIIQQLLTRHGSGGPGRNREEAQ